MIENSNIWLHKIKTEHLHIKWAPEVIFPQNWTDKKCNILITAHYFVDQAVSPIFQILIVFIFDEFDWYLSPNLGKILNDKKINGCQPKPENQKIERYIKLFYEKNK